MNWIEVTIKSTPDTIEELCSSLEESGVSGLVINNEEMVRDFLEKNRKYWDYVDDEVFEKINGACNVQFYLEDSDEGNADLNRIKKQVPGEYYTRTVKNEDWENNWKQYYKPIESGRRLIIVPEWEENPNSDRIPLRLDPGLIFGTGAHPTTHMCLEAIEKYKPETVLDLGCGSGILGIAAIILGAKKAVGCDIDEKAPKVVMENSALNGIYEDRLQVFSGDVLSDNTLKKQISGEYDIVFANIVADVIISLSPVIPEYLKDGGVFICSGIIEGRQTEVKCAIRKAGLEIIEEHKTEDWYCFECRKVRTEEIK